MEGTLTEIICKETVYLKHNRFWRRNLKKLLKEMGLMIGLSLLLIVGLILIISTRPTRAYPIVWIGLSEILIFVSFLYTKKGADDYSPTPNIIDPKLKDIW